MRVSPGSWLNYLDQLSWLAYLAFVAVISFLNEPYLSAQWLTISAGFYGFVTVYCLTLMLGGQCNAKALRDARYVIGFCVASLLWLWLQSVLQINNHLHERVFSDVDILKWFDPDLVWSVAPERTRWLLLSHLFVLSLFTVSLSLINSRRRVKQLLVLFIVVGAIHALVGVFAKYANLQLVALRQIDGHYDVARAWFVNRNHFASFICLCLMGGLSYQLKELISIGSGRFAAQLLDQLMSPRVFILVSVLLSLSAIILSQSRAGFLSIVFSASISIFLFRPAFGATLPRRSLMLIGGIAVAGLLAYFGDTLIARVYQDSFSSGERLDQWLITWQAIKQEFFLGYGGGSYAIVFQVFREYTDLRQVIYDQAHNDYLHIWLEQGLIGLLFWFGFLYLAVNRALLSIKNHPSRFVVSLSYAGLIVIVAALLQALVGYNLQIINIRSYFFVIIALLFAAPKIKHKTRLESA